MEELTGLLKRLYNGDTDFNEEELSELAYEFGSYEQYDSGRWQSNMTTTIHVNDKIFQLEWAKGLTEYQHDFFGDQPHEVEEYTETITVTRYKNKN